MKEKAESDAKLAEGFKALSEREAKFAKDEAERIAKIANEKDRENAKM